MTARQAVELGRGSKQRTLAPMGEADGLLVWYFPPGSKAARVSMNCREPHLSPVVTCASDPGGGVPARPRETCEIQFVRLWAVVLLFLPFAHISAQLGKSLLFPSGCSGALPSCLSQNNYLSSLEHFRKDNITSRENTKTI